MTAKPDTDLLPAVFKGRAFLTVDETAKVCRVSRASAYNAVNTGDLPSIKIGRRRLVPVMALRKKLLGEN